VSTDTKGNTGPNALDAAKLFLASLIVLGGIFAYYYFINESVLLRAIGVLVSVLIAGWVAMQSFQGQLLWKFIQGSRVELRKVVWPTREETIQTTAVVLVLALIGGVFFWLLDLALLAITQYIAR
jgi:preprotein translocase subunit SecE